MDSPRSVSSNQIEFLNLIDQQCFGKMKKVQSVWIWMGIFFLFQWEWYKSLFRHAKDNAIGRTN